MAQQAVPQVTNTDIEHRIQKLVDSKQKQQHTVSTLNPDARTILADYFTEVTQAVLEQAVIMARHRGSNTVDAADVYFALEKKLEISIAGSKSKTPLYKSIYRAKSLKSSSGESEKKAETTGARKTGGVKRKGAPA